MIDRISACPKSLDSLKALFRPTKKETVPCVKENLADRVQLSNEVKQKGESNYEQIASEVERHIDSHQLENIEQLKTDLKAIQAKSEVTAEQKAAIINDLESALQGSQKPNQEMIDRLIADFTESISDGSLNPREIVILQKETDALLNSANISDDQIDALRSDLEAIVESTQVTRQDIETIKKDVTQIVESEKG